MSANPRRLTLYKKVLQLRKAGKSYNQISKKFNIAKSTLSDWLSDKKWSETIKLQLANKTRIKNSNYLIKINALRHFNALRRHEEYRKKARLEYVKLKQNKLFLTGLSIYWGEGEKTDSGRVSLVNSDERMLKVIINFYRKALKIPEEKLRAALFIYNDIDEKKALKYWSKSLKISKNNFV
jgi:transposase